VTFRFGVDTVPLASRSKQRVTGYGKFLGALIFISSQDIPRYSFARCGFFPKKKDIYIYIYLFIYIYIFIYFIYIYIIYIYIYIFIFHIYIYIHTHIHIERERKHVVSARYGASNKTPYK